MRIQNKCVDDMSLCVLFSFELFSSVFILELYLNIHYMRGDAPKTPEVL